MPGVLVAQAGAKTTRAFTVPLRRVAPIQRAGSESGAPVHKRAGVISSFTDLIRPVAFRVQRSAQPR